MAPTIEKVLEMPHVSHDPHEIKTLPVLVVHAQSSCNCRCVMCDIWKNHSGESFRAGDLEPHLDSIRKLGVRWIVFSGGEPLMNPELPLLSAALRKENIRLTLLTTGLLLPKKADEVTANFDDVIVSLDGPPEIHDAIRRVDGAFALIESGVKALRERRADFRVTARTVVQKANHRHLRETARAAKRLNLNAISFLPADLTSTAFNRPLVWPVVRQEQVGLNLLELGALEAEIDLLIGDMQQEFKDGFVVETPEKLQRITRHFRVQLGLKSPESPICNAPWVSAVIETDGTVRPCFFHKPIGNLHQHGLNSILNGRTAREFRANLDIPNDPICKRCVCSLHYRP
ncbi:MAG TPA: radical SAM protein [Candidatus Acidoferrum sp.]